MNTINDTLMNNLNFPSQVDIEVPLFTFVINLVLSGFLSILLGLLYTHYGNVLSNRKYFSKNFFIITTTTMVIITVVKSSLALSLGLVGALSIIRFRAAIKEPEELGYLFLAIAIGLGFGADQTLITITAFIVISLSIILLNIRKVNEIIKNEALLSITSDNDKIELEKISDILNKNCDLVTLKRYDDRSEMKEFLFSISVSSLENLDAIKSQIKTLSPKCTISYLHAEQ